jgi:fructokinase
LPGYKPILASSARDLAQDLPRPQVFFFDRVSRGTLILAEKCAENGALVVFEPSGVGNRKLFREAWSVAHVVKYSHERLRELPDTRVRESVCLQIETLGPEGLRFRSRIPGCRSKRWQRIDAFTVDNLNDAGGSGDWCTAGIIARLGQHGFAGFRQTDGDRLYEALRFGHALAAWNCGFEGARAGMYSTDKEVFQRQVKAILSGTISDARHPAVASETQSSFAACLCPVCSEGRSQATRARRRSKQRYPVP